MIETIKKKKNRRKRVILGFFFQVSLLFVFFFLFELAYIVGLTVHVFPCMCIRMFVYVVLTIKKQKTKRNTNETDELR